MSRLTKEQIEHLQKRLLRERKRALRSLGHFGEQTKESAQQADSDLYSYSDHIADLGTDAMEREKMLLFASKEGRYLYRIEDALRRLYRDPEGFGFRSEERRVGQGWGERVPRWRTKRRGRTKMHSRPAG